MRSNLKTFSSQRGWVQALGAVLPAATSILGGLRSDKGAKAANEQAAALARENIALQKQFAQEGIRWRVKDARAAGVHPLFALGANTQSFSPVYSAFDNAKAGSGRGIANAGQAIGNVLQNMQQPVALPQGATVFPLGSGWPHYTDPKTGKAVPYSPAQADMYYDSLQRRANLSLTEAMTQAELAQARVASQPGRSGRGLEQQLSGARATAEAQDMADMGRLKVRWPDGSQSVIPAGTPQEVIEQIYGGVVGEAYGVARFVGEGWQALKKIVARRFKQEYSDQLPTWDELRK